MIFCRLTFHFSPKQMVPRVGVEPTWALSPLDFESSAYTNFATPAYEFMMINLKRQLVKNRPTLSLSDYPSNFDQYFDLSAAFSFVQKPFDPSGGLLLYEGSVDILSHFVERGYDLAGRFAAKIRDKNVAVVFRLFVCRYYDK